MFPLLNFDRSAIETAIKAAELRTTGEIAVYIEKRKYSDIDKRAKDIFIQLNIDKTEEHNGVLLYVNMYYKKIVVLGDVGISNQVNEDFWQNICNSVTPCFVQKKMTIGVVLGIMLIGEQLARLYPHTSGVRKNELSDTVIVGE